MFLSPVPSLLPSVCLVAINAFTTNFWLGQCILVETIALFARRTSSLPSHLSSWQPPLNISTIPSDFCKALPLIGFLQWVCRHFRARHHALPAVSCPQCSSCVFLSTRRPSRRCQSPFLSPLFSRTTITCRLTGFRTVVGVSPVSDALDGCSFRCQHGLFLFDCGLLSGFITVVIVHYTCLTFLPSQRYLALP